MKLARLYHEFVELDAEIIAVGPDPSDSFSSFFETHRIPYPGIPDPAHTIAETYNQRVIWWKFGRLPAQFLICKRGIVRFAEYGQNVRDITPPKTLLQYLHKM